MSNLGITQTLFRVCDNSAKVFDCHTELMSFLTPIFFAALMYETLPKLSHGLMSRRECFLDF